MQMTPNEWAQLAFLMFLACAVTMMVLAFWIRPHLIELRMDRDRWKAEAMGWREAEQKGTVVEGVKLIDPQDLYLHGAAKGDA